MLEKDIERILVTEQEINAISKRLGAEITKDYNDKKPNFLIKLGFLCM